LKALQCPCTKLSYLSSSPVCLSYLTAQKIIHKRAKNLRPLLVCVAVSYSLQLSLTMHSNIQSPTKSQDNVKILSVFFRPQNCPSFPLEKGLLVRYHFIEGSGTRRTFKLPKIFSYASNPLDSFVLVQGQHFQAELPTFDACLIFQEGKNNESFRKTGSRLRKRAS